VDISVTVCLCVFVLLRISPPTIKIVASYFAWQFIGVQGRDFPILGNFAPPEALNQTNRLHAKKDVHAIGGICQSDILFIVQWAHGPYTTLEMRRSWNRTACGCRIGMCGYTAAPEDGRTCDIYNHSYLARLTVCFASQITHAIWLFLHVQHIVA